MKSILLFTTTIGILFSLAFSAQSQVPINAAPDDDPAGRITSLSANTTTGYPVGSLIPIAVNDTTSYSQAAAVWANNQNTYFVAYRSSLNEIIVSRISTNGTVTSNIMVASAREYYSRSAPHLAYSPLWKELLVVWEDIDPITGYSSINGRIFNQSGIPISPSVISICTGVLGAQCFHPSAAYSPVQDRFLVVWQRTSGPEAVGDIEGEFITTAGALEKYIPIRLAAGNDSFSQPDVAFNHRRNEYLVAFQLTDCATFPCNTDILGHRVNYLGDVLDGTFGIKIGYNTTPESQPAVAAYPDPTETKCWLVVWTMQYAPDPLDRDIHINLLNCDGVPQGGTGWSLVATNLDDYNPAIAFNESTLKYLVVWTLTTNVPLNTSSIIGMEVTTSGDAAAAPQLIGGWFGTQGAVAAGSYGGFLAAYTESVAYGQKQILGSYWGFRDYIPLVSK